MSLSSYNEYEFRRIIDRALDKVKTILDNTKHPEQANEVPHTYNDKYLLAEFLTNTAIAAILNVLETIGLNVEGLSKLVEWSKGKRSVSLRFSAEENTSFVREETREEEDPTSHVYERQGGFLGGIKITDKIVRKITEYFWKFTFEYEISGFVGSDPKDKVVLFRRAGSHEIKTSSKVSPRKEVVVRPAIDTNISWLFARVMSGGIMGFSIDRTAKSCHTPRRNEEVEAALEFCGNLSNWFSRVHSYFLNDLFSAQSGHSLDLSAINSDGLFVPVLPFFESKESGESSSSSEGESEKGKELVLVTKDAGVLPLSYINPFLAEQLRSLNEKIDIMAKVFPADAKVITANEGRTMIAVLHGRDICQAYSYGVDYIEEMLRSQLIAAIGKIVTPQDFGNYMRFHYRKLYLEQYAPQLFCYAVRRPDHYPEGTVSIEESSGGNTPDPIQTVVCGRPARSLMYFPINAATKVGFGGDRYLHAWVSHQFSGYSSSSLSLVARARQFSSFILVVGRIAGASLFEPKHAIIIQNKDELKIPLLLEQIPTPKEFRDAIESLSPEQQRFAKAFRSMQLESTLFGVCIIQIKPQLEKLLRIPDDSLTKEIKLTQDLLSLFIDYQIPSDLLSYDGPAQSSIDVKLGRVKELVREMMEMIKKSKEEQLEEARREQEMRRAEREREEMRIRVDMEECVKREYKMEEESVKRKSSAKPMMMMKKSAAAPMARAMAAPAPAPMAAAVAVAPAPAPAPAPSAPAPVTPSTPTPTPEAPKEVVKEVEQSSSSEEVGEDIDYTKIPAALDAKFEALDEDSALRPTIINPGPNWSKSYQKSLLSPPAETSLGPNEHGNERNKAFDLLDALSRSGSLPIDQASLHIVLASTHCFDKSLVDTIIQDNVNPIEKVERSSLIVATTIHDLPPLDLLRPDQKARVQEFSPILFKE